MNSSHPVRAALAVAAAFITLFAHAAGQVPHALTHHIPSLPTGMQTGARLGSSVAVEGNYAVVGAPFDDVGGKDSGLVKVFHSVTGELLAVLRNPALEEKDMFGHSVAISGTLVVVGAPYQNLGQTKPGKAYVFDLGGGTPTLPVATLINPAPTPSDSFGGTVAISGMRVVVGCPANDTGASNTGSAYVYNLSRGTPTVVATTLRNPSPAANDRFGNSVAISGTRVVVGASLDDATATDSGSAYVYELSSGTPTVPMATLNNPSPAAGDHFGGSVAISGTRMVIAASADDTGATNAGSVYVYELSSGTPTVPVVTLNNPDPAVDDFFGGVDISGSRVVVGVPSDDTARGGAGIAYVYDMNSGTPTVPVATLLHPAPKLDDKFGAAVAISGTQVVIGVPFDDPEPDGETIDDTGSAMVFDLGSGALPVPVAVLISFEPEGGSQFGNAVAISGTRVVVGANYNDTGADAAGIAAVYDFGSGTPTVPMVTLENPTPASGEYFGSAVGISGTRVVVGASDDRADGEAGRAYVYDMSSATPTVPVFTLSNPTPESNDKFGCSAAISGTLVAIGAYWDDSLYLNGGSVYVYDLSSETPTVPVATLNNPSPTWSEEFGVSVAISGTRVVVGAPFDDVGATDAGCAYVYDMSSGTPAVPVAILNNPAPQTFDQFGDSVSISGTLVVVGAPGDNNLVIDAGAAYVYDLSSGTPTVPVVTLNNPIPANVDGFGYEVAISGTQVVIVAPANDTGAPDAGCAYVYDLSSGTPTVPVATLNNPTPSEFDYFGSAVAISGTQVVVGVSLDDTVGLNNGFAYVFEPANSDSDNDGLLDSWENAKFGTTIGHAAGDDWDKDGIVELLEEAFDHDPLKPNASAAPAPVMEGGFLTIALTKRAGVTYLVQTAATPDDAAFSAATTTVLTDNATTLKVRDKFPQTTPGSRLLRVKVTAAP